MMLGRVVEIGGEGRHLALKRGFMLVKSAGEEVARIALDDIAVLLANAHGLTYSNNLLLALAKRNAMVVLCGPNHMPAAWLWPMMGHYAQTERMAAQIAASKPLNKRLWQALVRAKIDQQAAVLDAVGKPSGGVAALGRRVRSGDPENMEAQAARRYWPLLFGKDFRRDRAQVGVNSLLNYGYTVLRAAMARAVVAAGLHPSLGLHHRTRTDPFCLVSDLMEPFRPLVDLSVFRLVETDKLELGPDSKAALAGVVAIDMQTDRGVTPLATCQERLAGSLARTYGEGALNLELPFAPLPLDAARLGRK